MRSRAALVALGALLGMGSEAAAQEVVLRGAADVAVDRRLSRLLEDRPLLVLANRRVPASDTIRGPVLVLDATLVLEGVVLGDLVLVDAGAFLRPDASVTGDVVNVAGGLYRSELARVGGRVLDLPTAPYRVVREPGVVVIEATRRVSPLALDGLLGLHAPSYDRVNGLTLVWGASYRLPMVGRQQPEIRGRVGWHTQRGDPGYGVEVRVRRGASVVSAGRERGWDTNERWIRGDLLNSLGYLLNGQDHRDYHETEFSWVALSREFSDRSRRLRASVTVRGQAEDAASLEAGTPWTLFRAASRENLPVDDGRTASLVGSVELAWAGDRVRHEGTLTGEAARRTRGGEFHFGRVAASGSLAVQGLANHTLALRYFLQRPVGGASLPRQRWSFVGGPQTLFTLPLAEHHGDRVTFVETSYEVPLPEGLALPVLGTPRLALVHAAGMARTSEEDRSLHQEIALQLNLPILFVRYSVVPDEPSVTDLSVGLSWPFGRRNPWE